LKLQRTLLFLFIACFGMATGWTFAQTANPLPDSPPHNKSVAADASWLNLTDAQKKALAPLAPHWSQISPGQKNKWVAMSKNFDNLSAKEQATLHERMADWASLSPQQRAQARLTFNETKNIAADEKKTHWEAYQALSAEEKKKLAAQQKTGIQGAATASQAPPPNKVMRLPGKSTPTSEPGKSTPAVVIDKKTLLPTTVAIPEGA
jgi:hypothetical protein